MVLLAMRASLPMEKKSSTEALEGITELYLESIVIRTGTLRKAKSISMSLLF